MNEDLIEELGLNNKICFEYLRILSQLSMCTLATRFQNNSKRSGHKKIYTKYVYRLIYNTNSSKKSNASDLQIIYNILREEIKKKYPEINDEFESEIYKYEYESIDFRVRIGHYFILKGECNLFCVNPLN